MSVGSDGAYDIILQDRITNPTTQLGLVLAYTAVEGVQRKMWSESRVAPLPPKQAQGALMWTHKDPITDFVFAQSDWSGGAFRPYYQEQDNRYAKSDGVDLRWEGVAALGQRRTSPRSGVPIKGKIQSNYLVSNGHFEEGVTTGWTAGTGTALAVDTDTVNTGNYSLKLTVDQGTSATDMAKQALANPTLYRSRVIKVIAYVQRASGSDAGIIMRVFDGTNTTNVVAVTASTFTAAIATHTVAADADELTISFRNSATTSNAAHVFYVDDVSVLPTGGTECVGFATRTPSSGADQLYAAIGRTVVLWNESTYTWDVVYFSPTDGTGSEATDIIEFDNDIFVAYGEPASTVPHQYISGSDTTWATTAINATTTHQDNHARYWVKARDGYTRWALWKAGPSSNQGTETNKMYSSQTPKTTWLQETALTVGSSGRAITGLHAHADTFIVAKVDGLWLWDAITADFVNITPEWEHDLDSANGSLGQTWLGRLYFASAQQGFFSWNMGNGELTNLSSLLVTPRISDIGGRITAMGAASRELILGLDQPVADATSTKTCRLVTLNASNQIHTIAEPSMSIIDAISTHIGTRLWVFGRAYDSSLEDYVATSFMWELPSKSAAPYADVVPAIEQNGFFHTSIWSGGMPDTDKALIALTVWCEDVNPNRTITVDFGRDGRAANTTRLGIFNTTDRIQTLFFKNIDEPTTNAVCRFAQLRFTFATNDTTSPKMFAFALHTQLAPRRIRAWDIGCYVGQDSLLRTDVPDPLSKAEIETIFQELELQAFPLTMVEDLGQSHGGDEVDGSSTHQVRLVDYRRVPNSSDEHGQEMWNLRLQEVPIDA
jgi:hypothetical protein